MVVYACPLLDDGHDVVYAEGRQTEVVSWMETDNVATTLNRFCGQQGMGGSGCSRSRRWENGGVVVLEHHGCLVVLVDGSVCAGIPRAEIAVLVILGEIGRRGRLCLTEPRTLRAMGRDEDVCVGEGVVWGG